MTYNELLNYIKNLTEEQRDTDITVYDNCTDTYIKIESVAIADNDVVENQPILIFNADREEIKNEMQRM